MNVRRIVKGARVAGAAMGGLCLYAIATTVSGSAIDFGRADAQLVAPMLVSPPLLSDRCTYSNSWLAPRSGGRQHQGVDIIAPRGTPVVAVVDGVISRQRFDRPGSMSGNHLNVRSANNSSYYMYLHLDQFAADISLGDTVTAGQVIGYVGSTGAASIPHLHFEVHPLGGPAVDPKPYVDTARTCSTPSLVQGVHPTAPATTRTSSSPDTTAATPAGLPPIRIGPSATQAAAPAPSASPETPAPLASTTQPAPATQPPATQPPPTGTPVALTGTLQPGEVLTTTISGLPGLPALGSTVDVSVSISSVGSGTATAWACETGLPQYGSQLSISVGTNASRFTLGAADGNLCISADVAASYVVSINGQI